MSDNIDNIEMCDFNFGNALHGSPISEKQFGHNGKMEKMQKQLFCKNKKEQSTELICI